jgi:hypothetical protein
MRQRYNGSCHCGRVRFELTAATDHVRICDCSICRRRGALIFRVDEADFRLLTPLVELTLCQWRCRVSLTRYIEVLVLESNRPGEGLPLPHLRHSAIPHAEPPDAGRAGAWCQNIRGMGSGCTVSRGC